MRLNDVSRLRLSEIGSDPMIWCTRIPADIYYSWTPLDNAKESPKC